MDKKKVLVVDDEVDFSEVVKMMLEISGYTVITANSGEDALKKVKAEKPDAVVLDILMSGVNGLDVLKEIRQEDKRLPIFITTAFSNEERLKVANMFDASGFILKTDDLKKEIQNIGAAIQSAEKYKK